MQTPAAWLTKQKENNEGACVYRKPMLYVCPYRALYALWVASKHRKCLAQNIEKSFFWNFWNTTAIERTPLYGFVLSELHFQNCLPICARALIRYFWTANRFMGGSRPHTRIWVPGCWSADKNYYHGIEGEWEINSMIGNANTSSVADETKRK